MYNFIQDPKNNVYEAAYYYIQQIYKVNDLQHIDRQFSEDEMFQGYETSTYLTALYNIVTSFRYQR